LSDVNYNASSEEAYFLLYEDKASKMKGWQLTSEIAKRLEAFDLLKSAGDPQESQKMDRAMRQIEILTKENLKRR
jgi:hypothetical protein